MELTADASVRLLPGPPAPPSEWARWGPTFLALGALWLMVLNQQRLEWAVNPTYAYGWAVPVLAGYLFWARWRTRPDPGPVLGAGWFTAGVVLVLAACLPVRVIQEANPDWVKINWSQAALWMGLVLLALGRVGGWRYAWYFIFPLLFCFTALPWPVWMEESLSQTLMGLNAEVSAEVLTLFGTPALAVGNMVQVGEHWVNVEEACSGIRSLQTAFMMSLFLGEFYRFGAMRRVVLLIASFGVAFVVNLVRTVILTNLAKTGGVDEWHDTVGTVAMVISLLALWLLAEGLSPARGSVPVAKAAAGRPLIAPFTWRVALLIGVWLIAVEGATAAWYRSHERALPPPLAWNLDWPQSAPDFVEDEFGERMVALLKFNTGRAASWTTTGGDRVQMYYLQWEPGRVSKFLSSAHYPTVCLPATGMTFVGETGVWACAVNGIEIPFTTYDFAEGNREVYVFHAVLEDRPATSGTRLSYRQVSSRERLDSVWRGERNLGQRVMGIALRGPKSPAAARAAVTTMLAAAVQTKAPRPSTLASLTP